MKIGTILLLISIIFYSNNVQAQREATTEDGEIIVLEENGTWRSLDDRAGEPGDTTIAGCDYRMLERDQFTEEDWIIMSAKPIVKYTRQSKEDEVKWLPFLQAETYCLYTGGNVGAYFKFILQSANVNEKLEGIDEGNSLKIFTPGNPPVEAAFRHTAIARENNDDETTTYVSHVQFSDVQAKVLSQNPVEKIGVQWNGKYLEYPVTNNQLFQKQLQCISARL